MTQRASADDWRNDSGPFDLIGDIHGCYDELVKLVEKLGYRVGPSGAIHPPTGRKLIFLGDLVDRGPKIVEVLQLAMNAVHSGFALCVPGNHDDKFARWLRGNRVELKHGLQESVKQIESASPEFREQVKEFLQSLESQYALDGGKLVVAHAGMKEDLQGKNSPAARSFALYGETTGERDELGLPIRYAWAKDYRGPAMVVYGHTPVKKVEWVNRTVNIDTGCVFGGELTALKYPELELVAVPAAREYWKKGSR